MFNVTPIPNLAWKSHMFNVRNNVGKIILFTILLFLWEEILIFILSPLKVLLGLPPIYQ